MRVVFMGTPDFAVPTLRRLIESTTVVAIYTQPDKPVGRGLQMQASPVKRVGIEKGIPVLTPEKVSAPEEADRLQSWKADFFVVVAYGQILKLPVIETPKIACVNIHSSLLPRWRGAAPIHWALLSGDAETGVTTMLIEPKLDAGDILLQTKTPISMKDTTATLHDRLGSMGADLILPTLEGLFNRTLVGKKQDEDQVTIAKKLNKEMEWLEPTLSAAELDLRVRALNPWPGTRVRFENKMILKIKEGRLMNSFDNRAGAPPALIDHFGVLALRTSRGIFQIELLQEEGKKAQSSFDFMNGIQGRKMPLPWVWVSSKTDTEIL